MLKLRWILVSADYDIYVYVFLFEKIKQFSRIIIIKENKAYFLWTKVTGTELFSVGKSKFKARRKSEDWQLLEATKV